MAGPLLFDRVRESSTTTGTGDFTLDGAVTGGFQAFSSVLAINDTTYYVMQNSTFNEWEVGIGTLTATTTLQRTTVLASSNSNALVDFSAGTKAVFADASAAFLQPLLTVGDTVYQAATGRPTALPIGTAGQVLTVAVGIPSWATGGAGTTLPVADTQTIVQGSVDATKLLRFEVDGFTAGATRVLTPPNADINLPGTNIVNTWVLVQTFSSSSTAPFGSGGGCERFGAGAGIDAATGADNVTIGSAAGDALTSGASNIFIGTNSGGAATTASDNVAIGAGAFSGSAVAANQNIAIGTNAMASITTGDVNVAIGYLAMDALTSGTRNVGIGTNACGKITDAADNCGIGDEALASIVNIGQRNVGIGTDSGTNITSGDDNVGVGRHAIDSVTTASGNTGIGGNAGATINTGANNTCIGFGADTVATSTANSIALGVDAISTNNQFIIGPGIDYQTWGGTSTTQTRERADLTVSWIDSTDATRKARVVVNVWDTAARELFRGDTDGSGANFSFFAAGSFGAGRNVVFVPNAAVNPSTNPTAGGILYSNAGAGTWRGSGGTVTAFGPAGPHCGRCGYDFWSVACRNDLWNAYLYLCGMCGKKYRKGPRSVLRRLTTEQQAEILE